MSTIPPIYVINLDRSPERLARITADLHRHGLAFRRVRAVDGAGLKERVGEYNESANRARYLAPLTPGEIACVLSHREVWRLMVDDAGSAAAVVLEDDAGFGGDHDGLVSLVGEIARSPRPELVKLYDLSSPRRAASYRRRRPLLPALTTTAQALNRSAAKALLRFTEDFYEPADVIIQRWWDHGVRVTSLEPPMFSEIGHDEESTIRARGRQPTEGRLLRELRRPLWQVRRLASAVAASAGSKFSD